jgi:ribosomal protein L37AE/L43A
MPTENKANEGEVYVDNIKPKKVSIPNIIKCPNCDQESLKQVEHTNTWKCSECSYKEVR